METTQDVVIPRQAAVQLALHARLAAHHAAVAGSGPGAAEAVLAWAVLVATSGGVDAAPVMDALPSAAEVVEDPAVLPAYRAAADQAEELLAHFECEELFDLAALYGDVVSIIEGEMERMALR